MTELLTIDKTENTLICNSNIAQKRFNRFPNAMTMSDDFDDDLGDDFWFGKEYCDNKE